MNEYIRLKYGRYNGLPLSQVLFRDPKWFYIEHKSKAFGLESEELQKRADDLYCLSRSIKIPDNNVDSKYVGYYFKNNTRQFLSIKFEHTNHPNQYLDKNIDVFYSECIDMKFLNEFDYNDRCFENFILAIIELYWGDDVSIPSIEDCEYFFNNELNFNPEIALKYHRGLIDINEVRKYTF
jgi:hypothetical protein